MVDQILCPNCGTELDPNDTACRNCGTAAPHTKTVLSGDVPASNTQQSSDYVKRLKEALADKYVIERGLGQGGMATVYLADDIKHNRKVAVKVMRPELAASIGTARFVREIQMAAQLNHPHILALFDSGEADGFLYYVMPFVEGESLRDRLNREKQLPVEEAIRLTQEIAAALSYAHSRGVVHRDIKPENILLSHGEAVLADLGIARAVTESGGENLTETGLAIGSPTYMSPEQASGEEVDGRADIYSLACVLFEMFTGEPPYSGTSAHALMAKHAMDAVPSPRIVRQAVPDYVESAVRKALGKVPADRFQVISQFAEALSGATASIDAPSLPKKSKVPSGQTDVPGVVPRPRIMRARRRRSRWWAVSVVATTGALAAALLIWRMSTMGSRLTSIVVGPIQTTISDPSLTGQLGPWGVADEIGALFASDSEVGVVDSRAVSTAAAVFSGRNHELSTEEWVQVARNVGANLLVLFDTSHIETSAIPEPEPLAGRFSHGYVSVTLFNLSGATVDTVLFGSFHWITEAEHRGSPPRATAAGVVATILESALQPGPTLFPWGIDSMLGSIERNAIPRVVEAITDLESGLYLEAVEQFQHALELDPDFSLAAVGLLQAGTLAGDQQAAADRAARRAWELRDRLSTRDRDFVAAFLGVSPDYPASTTTADFLDFRETVLFSYLEEGRIAAVTGRNEEAIRAYHRYLTLLGYPPGDTLAAESARNELARLIQNQLRGMPRRRSR